MAQQKEYDNSNSGTLFRNEDKDAEHPNWADYQGSAEVDGVQYWLSAWVKEVTKGDNKGKKFFSLSFRKKESRGGGGSSGRGSGGNSGGGGNKPADDIPF